MSLNPGTHLGRYQITASLGAGGMGEVYRARDTRLGRDVAIKVLPESLAADAKRLAHLENEARAVAALNHPNIVVLYSVEEEGGIRFLTMELVEGQTFTHLIQPGGLPLLRVLGLAIPLADALSAAHERGVIHRDLKPANVMLSREGRVKVLDFGLAKFQSPESLEATRTVTTPPSEQVVGTVPYMAPEQIRAEPVDARTDIFALGILLYELVTGRRPFRGATPAEVTSAILRDAPTQVQTLRADFPSDMGRIIGRCLEKDPEQRIQTAKDVRNELELVRRALEPSQPGPNSAPAVISAPDVLPSIAVLQFANRSREQDDEYFAEGITEDVIAQLCKVRTLKVISRASVMPFKGHEENLPEIASRLGVANLLEGSVRRAGNRVRIVAQLIEVASGRHLWAETYDRQLTDVFVIQTDVALQITAALKAQLAPDERERIRRKPTHDIQAYDHYMRGRYCLVRWTSQEMRRSIEHFERAIEHDPELALAYVGLAQAYTELGEIGALRRGQTGSRAIEAANKAVALDSELGQAHCVLAYARLVFEFDWVRAEEGFKRSLELSPNGADTYDLYGRMCAGLGRFDEAIALTRRAFELDPLSHPADVAAAFLRAGRNEEATRAATEAVEISPQDSRPHATLGWALIRQGRVDEGLAHLERAVALTPSEELWLAQLGQAHAMAGNVDRAREVLRQLEDPSRPSPASPYHLAYVYTGLGDSERAMDSMERAFTEGSGPVYGIKGSFLLAPLRHHPRFLALLKRMHLE